MGARRTRTAVLLVSVLVLGGVTVGPVGVVAGADDVVLTIAVEDSFDRDVDDVTLEVSWDGGSTTATTLSNGQAQVEVPDGEDVTIRVRPDAYVRNDPVEIEDVSEETVTVDVTRSGSIDLSVDRAGSPVAGAQVELMRNNESVVNGTTDDSGRFDTGAIERRSYTLLVTKPGHLQYENDLSVTGDISWDVTLQEGSVTVTFDVVDDHYDSVQPVRNASISVERIGTVSTLGNGEATLSVPVNTQRDVEITKDGYDTVTTSIDINESAFTKVVTITRTPTLTLRSSNERVVVGETVRIEVVDAYGDPVADATATINGTEVGTTNAEGAILVPVKTAGDHRIVVSADGLEAETTIEGVKPAAERTATATTTATATETATETQTETTVSSGSGPGFGVLGALVALLSVAALRRR